VRSFYQGGYIMNFCRKCGKKAGSGEPFCGNCGASIVEDSHFNSSSNDDMNSKISNNFNIYANEILEITKGMLKKPISTVLNCDKNLEKNSCGILALFLSVLFGILNVWNMIISTDIMDSLFTDSIFGFGGISQLISESLSGGKIFFISVILFIIGVIILAGSNYLIGKHSFKSLVAPLTILKVTLCSAIPFIVGLFLSVILSYISSVLGFIAIFTGMVVAMISLFRGITEVTNISEEITIFILPISYLLMFWGEYIIIASIIKSAFRFSYGY
jgi:hypothetical protein